MTVLVYLLSLPLAVSTWAVIPSVRDGAPATETLFRLAWRALIAAGLIWLGDGYLGVAWAFATAIALHGASFVAFRVWLDRAGKKASR